MIAQLGPIRRWNGFKPLQYCVVPVFDAKQFRQDEAVELCLHECGLLDIVEPTITVLLKPEEANRLGEALQLAALAACGAHVKKVPKQ